MSRVLIVDDHAFIRRGVQAILHSHPEWEFSGEASNGPEAIRLVGELKPQIIIMDVSMPGMNGIEATRLIRKSHPRVKVILLTLHNSPELIRSALAAGASGYLLKTDAERELLRALNVVVAEGTYVSPGIDADVITKIVSDQSAGIRQLH